MRRTIARTPLTVLIAITIAGCMEQTGPPARPDAADAINFPSLAGRTLSGADAVRHRVSLLETELADTRLLELNAALNRLDVEERRQKVTAELERFKALDTRQMKVNNTDCQPEPLSDKDTYLSAAVLWPGVGVWVYASGFSVVEEPDGTKHRIYTYGEGGSGHYPGFPSYTAGTAVDATSDCTQVFTVYSDTFYISFAEWCWWAYGESMHRVINSDTEEYTTALYDRCGGDRIGPVV